MTSRVVCDIASQCLAMAPSAPALNSIQTATDHLPNTPADWTAPAWIQPGPGVTVDWVDAGGEGGGGKSRGRGGRVGWGGGCVIAGRVDVLRS